MSYIAKKENKNFMIVELALSYNHKVLMILTIQITSNNRFALQITQFFVNILLLASIEYELYRFEFVKLDTSMYLELYY